MVKENTIKDKLYTAFSDYIQKVVTVVGKRNSLSVKQKTREKLSIAYIKPRLMFEELELSPEFEKLVLASSEVFGEKILAEDSDPEGIQDSFSFYMHNFFYRSGCYLKILEGNSIDIDDCFEQLWNAYSRSDDATFTFLSLLTIRFPENLIDLGKIKIQRFTKEELDDLCQNQINRVFYPEDKWDTEKLSLFWFIREEESKSKVEQQFASDFVLRDKNKTVPVEIELYDQKIRQLVLFDWNSSKDTEEINRKWEGFSMPIVLRIDNDLLWPTGLKSPNINEIFPLWSVEKDSKTGEDVEHPLESIKLEKNYLEELKKLVKNAREFSDIRPDQWKFLDTAMGYLAKAFFSEGLEQLLWHMTTLEALFCLDGEGNIQEKIVRRLSSALDKDEVEIREQIKNLYKKRSELVHGNLKPKQVYYGDLYQARDLARRSVVWFIDYLLDIHKHLSKQGTKTTKDYPQRKMILTSLGHVKEWKKPFDVLDDLGK